MPQVNMWNGFDTGVPFGGYKMSGIGREKGEAALDHYTQASAHQDCKDIVSQSSLPYSCTQQQCVPSDM